MREIGRVKPREPVHAVLLQEIALGVLAHRGGLGRGAELCHRIDQQLERDGRAALDLGELADHGREVAAGAVAADGETFRIDAELGGVGGDVACGSETILHRGGKGMLRREAVVDRDDAAEAAVREAAREVVMAVEIADHETAAVIEHETRQHRGVRAQRGVDADGDVAGGARNIAVLDAADRRLAAAEDAGAHRGARRLRPDLVQFGQLQRRHLVEDVADMDVEGHEIS